MTYLGARLRSLRKQDDLNQSVVANAIGVARSTISMWESGEREPDFEALEALADYFNVPINTFFASGECEEINPLSALSEPERQLLFSYRNLNTEGQSKLLDYADDLVSSGKYIKSNPSDMGQKQA